MLLLFNTLIDRSLQMGSVPECTLHDKIRVDKAVVQVRNATPSASQLETLLGEFHSL